MHQTEQTPTIGQQAKPSQPTTLGKGGGLRILNLLPATGRVDQEPPQVRNGYSWYHECEYLVYSGTSGPSCPPLGPEVIFVSEDEMNITDSPKPHVPELEVQTANPYPFGKPSSKRVPLSSSTVTQRLEGVQSRDSSDPIESADDVIHVQNANKVKQMVATIEKRPAVPQVNLKDAMRSKEGNKIQARKLAPLLGSPRSYLPLKEWCLGLKHFHGEHHLSWSSNDTIAVRKGPPPLDSSPPIITLRAQDIDTTEYYDPSEIGEYPVVLVVVTRYGSRVIPVEHADYFSPGKGEKGKITLKFNKGGFGWSTPEYKKFIEWLKSCGGSDAFRGPGSEAVWTRACQAASSGMSKGAELQLLRDRKFSKRRTPTHSSPGEAFLSSQTLLPAPLDTRPLNLLPQISGSKQEPTQLLAPAAPRSSIRQAEARRKSLPKPDPDEVILVYPPGAPGAVNITNADLDRLQPGQYLNDTLIEFGLKHWLKELESSDPALAKQIHVFSSFFYKKLNKKNMDEGYESVQKWTAKFNIFDKKYIIVPINEKPNTPPVGPPSVTESPIDPSNDPIFQDTTDTEEQDAPLDLSNFKGSCSIVVTNNESTLTPATCTESDFPDDAKAHPPSFEMDLDEFDSQPPEGLSPTISDLENTDHRPIPIDVDADDTLSQDGRDMANVTKLVNEDMSDSPQDIYKPIPSSEFYNKGKAEQTNKLPPMEVDGNESDQVTILPSELPDTYIFTLDSLGSGHTQAINQLSRYLKMEASTKLMLKDTGDPRGKKAIVPSQPNYCDCGLYLVHLAKTFMSDPAKYCEFITTPRKKTPSRDERMEIWKGESLSAMRDDLANKIRTLSAEWKKHKQKAKQKEEGKIEVDVIESSDDEVDIIDTTPHQSLMPKTNGKGKSARLRGD
ncbi:hypothetical protein BD779DRAFT_1499711 [Infundibulicybe gibba]|nr:hypothetical protein BD779DRAFT_1499711 [Infundibulicybe gibba]